MRQHREAHAKDVHKIDRGDSHKPIKVVGGDENKSSHGTIYQNKMQRDETSTRGTDTKNLSIFAKQIAAKPELFD